MVLVGAKQRIFRSELERFADNLALVKLVVKGEPMRVTFGYFLHPTAVEAAKERSGIFCLWPYD